MQDYLSPCGNKAGETAGVTNQPVARGVKISIDYSTVWYCSSRAEV